MWVLSSGVVMRGYRDGDAGALAAAVEEERHRLERWMPWVPYSTTVEDFAAFIGRSRLQEADGTGFHHGLFDGEAVVGGCGASVDLVNRQAEIGYWVAGSHEGRGIVTEAVVALLAFLFDDYAMNRVVIRAAVGNTRSRAIAERLGFTLEGIQRQSLILEEIPTDAAVYSLLAEEWGKKS